MLSSCVCMCVETTALFSETIRHSLGPGCKSQGIPPPASTSPEQTTDVCAVTSSFLLGFCGCHSVSHAFVTSTTQPLNSHLGSASEATLPWARDITFLRPAFSVNWRYYDLSGEVVVGLMGWNIDASPVPSLKPGLHECIGFKKSRWKQGGMRSWKIWVQGLRNCRL